jgi:hypothetical protein
MKNHDSTEKDAKAPTNSQEVATPKTDKTTTTGKELTDEEFAKVVGGVQGAFAHQSG